MCSIGSAAAVNLVWPKASLLEKKIVFSKKYKILGGYLIVPKITKKGPNLDVFCHF